MAPRVRARVEKIEFFRLVIGKRVVFGAGYLGAPRFDEGRIKGTRTGLLQKRSRFTSDPLVSLSFSG